jgi:hypothetical protein
MAKDIPQLIASARGFLTSQAYGADERPVLIAIVDQLEKTHAALKPFATIRMDTEDGEQIANWHEQHDSEGVSLTLDPDFENGSTLTIGQFKGARAAFQGEA